MWWDGVGMNCQARACSGVSPSPFPPTFPAPEFSVVVPGGLPGLGEAQGTAWGQVRAGILVLAHLADFG